MATQSDQPNTGVVTTIVVIGVFAMIAISVMVTAMVRSENTRLDERRPGNADLDTVAALDRSQFARLTAAPSWIAEPGGKVAIPIDRAMRLVVAEYQKDPQAASPPPPPGLVMPPPAPATGATPMAAGATPGVTPPSPAAVSPAAAPSSPAAAPSPGSTTVGPVPGLPSPTRPLPPPSEGL